MEITPSRRYPRVPIDVQLTELDDDQACCLRLHDISVDGLYAAEDQDCCLDTAVSLNVEFFLPGDEEPVWALCDVIRDDRIGFRDGHALRFQRVSERDRSRIERYVSCYHRPVAQPAASAAVVAQSKQVVKFRAVSDLLC